ncbi:DUF4367 domain-containing protein [Methanolobus sp. WCC4]|uniref:DUF4367 domain-containing protein n=1 Tax=Methanolobus sp. WCC4 TaxID=3125784 RepID=UPI0030FC4A44
MRTKLLVILLLMGAVLLSSGCTGYKVTSDSINSKGVGVNEDSMKVYTSEKVELEQAQEATNNNLLIPSYLPDGYELERVYLVDKRNEIKFTGYVSLECSNGENTLFVDEDFSEKMELTFEDPEPDDDVEVEIITIGGHEGELRIIQGTLMELIWDIDGIRVSVSSTVLEKSELIRIAESVE